MRQALEGPGVTTLSGDYDLRTLGPNWIAAWLSMPRPGPQPERRGHQNRERESATYLAYAGRVDEAIALMTDAMRLDPFHPDWFLWDAGIIHYTARQYGAAIDAIERGREPDADTLLFLAASYAQLGRLPEAQATVKRVLALDPNATVAKWAAQQPYKNPADLEHYKDGLRKAGLPPGGLTN